MNPAPPPADKHTALPCSLVATCPGQVTFTFPSFVKQEAPAKLPKAGLEGRRCENSVIKTLFVPRQSVLRCLTSLFRLTSLVSATFQCTRVSNKPSFKLGEIVEQKFNGLPAGDNCLARSDSGLPR